jgi:hypothetical protein
MLGLGNSLMTPTVSSGLGKRGSLIFDGVGDYMTVGGSNSIFNDTFTITWRIMFDDSNITNHQISGQANATAQDMTYLGFLSGTHFYGWHKSNNYLNNMNGGTMWTENAGTPTPWITIGMSFDCTGGGSNATGRFFCELPSKESHTAFTSMPITNVNAFDSPHAFGIGVWINSGGSAQWIHEGGAIADVAIYKGYAFTLADFQEIFDSPEKDYRTLSHAAYLTSYFPFGEAGMQDVIGGLSPEPGGVTYGGDPTVSMVHPSD